MAAGQNAILAFQDAGNEIIQRQTRITALPKTVGFPVREVWALQPRFEIIQGGRPFRLIGHPRFRAAYDFLVLRAMTGEADPALADWWTRFQTASEAEQKSMIRSGGHSAPRNRTRRRPRKKPTQHAPGA
jgi:poly(A) polymerase